MTDEIEEDDVCRKYSGLEIKKAFSALMTDEVCEQMVWLNVSSCFSKDL